MLNLSSCTFTHPQRLSPLPLKSLLVVFCDISRHGWGPDVVYLGHMLHMFTDLMSPNTDFPSHCNSWGSTGLKQLYIILCKQTHADRHNKGSDAIMCKVFFFPFLYVSVKLAEYCQRTMSKLLRQQHLPCRFKQAQV